MHTETSLTDMMEQEMVVNKHTLKHTLDHSTLTEVPSHLSLIPMTDAEFNTLYIRYSIVSTQIGDVLLAATDKGICFTGFSGVGDIDAWEDLQRRFPKATFVKDTDAFQQAALRHIEQPKNNPTPLPFHVRGTAFQLEIWRKLLQIPFGSLSTYTEIGESKLKARATGTAVGSNPVSFFIPCHRVIRSNGEYHGFYWGLEMKRRLLYFESVNR